MAPERLPQRRTPCRVTVLVEADGCLSQALACDLSASGAVIRWPQAHQRGEKIRLLLPMAELPPLDAEVTRVVRMPNGDLAAGVRFDPVEARDMAAWAGFLRALA